MTTNSAVGDPPDFNWQKDPKQWPTYPTYPTYPGTIGVPQQPWTPPPAIPLTQMDLQNIINQVRADQAATKKTLEERLDSIERTLTVILELMGTVLAARSQQISKETESGTKMEELGK